MPAKSEKQRRAAGAALGAKRRGDLGELEGPGREMAESMSEDQLRDFARKPGGGGKKHPAKRHRPR